MARAIDADVLYEEITGFDNKHSDQMMWEWYADMVERQPTIEPKQEWISVKDRLPEIGQEVLVFWDDGIDTGRYVGGEVDYDVYWMPLPEPPKEGE